MPEGEPEPDGHRPLPLNHQIPGCVVDGRDMVSVDRVTETESVSGQTRADGERPGASERIMVRDHQRDQQEESHDVEPKRGCGHEGDGTPLTGVESAEHSRASSDSRGGTHANAGASSSVWWA